MRNRRGGPRVAGRHGIFPRQDEEALRELAFVAASAFVRNEHLGCMEKAMEMAPEITACRREEAVLHKIAAGIINPRELPESVELLSRGEALPTVAAGVIHVPLGVRPPTAA